MYRRSIHVYKALASILLKHDTTGALGSSWAGMLVEPLKPNHGRAAQIGRNVKDGEIGSRLLINLPSSAGQISDNDVCLRPDWYLKSLKTLEDRGCYSTYINPRDENI